MKPNLENLAEKTQNVRLSSAEKFDMLQDLRAYADTHPAKSPYQAVWFRQAFAVYASAFILVVASGATSLAAEQALPGDALYSIKTNVNEGVVRTLPLPASAKAKVEISMIDRRMGELEQMIVADKDTPEKVDMLMAKIGDHKEDFDQHVLALNDDSVGGETDEIQSELETVVDAHIVVLEEITSEDDEAQEPEVPKAVDDAPEPEPVDSPEPEGVADEQMFASEPANESADMAADSPVMMTMMLKTASPIVDIATMKAVPAEEEVSDPIVEEVEEFSRTEIKPFSKLGSQDVSATSVERIRDRESLRQRIFQKAEKRLNIDIDAFVDGLDGSGADVNI